MASNNSSENETQKIRKVGLRLGAMVGGFILLIIIIGWIYISFQRQ